MAYRVDLKLVEVQISAAHFCEFDHGQTVEESVPAEWELRPGDQINWACAQYDGRAEVINCSTSGIEEVRCALRKAH